MPSAKRAKLFDNSGVGEVGKAEEDLTTMLSIDCLYHIFKWLETNDKLRAAKGEHIFIIYLFNLTQHVVFLNLRKVAWVHFSKFDLTILTYFYELFASEWKHYIWDFLLLTWRFWGSYFSNFLSKWCWVIGKAVEMGVQKMSDGPCVMILILGDYFLENTIVLGWNLLIEILKFG